MDPVVRDVCFEAGWGKGFLPSVPFTEIKRALQFTVSNDHLPFLRYRYNYLVHLFLQPPCLFALESRWATLEEIFRFFLLFLDFHILNAYSLSRALGWAYLPPHLIPNPISTIQAAGSLLASQDLIYLGISLPKKNVSTPRRFFFWFFNILPSCSSRQYHPPLNLWVSFFIYDSYPAISTLSPG